MTLKLSLDLTENPTYGQLFQLADLARAAGIKDDEPLTVEADEDFGVHTVAVNLGNLTGIARPVLIDVANAREYADSLYRELRQESDVQHDGAVLRRLLEDLNDGLNAAE